MARIDTLPNFLTDIAGAIRSKTGSSELIAPENYDKEIESISGGGYTGQLPNNSVITRVINEGTELHVYLSVDKVTSGTRIYYKKDDIPSLNDSYIDIPRNEPYGIIPNVDNNSMYGLRVASYIIYGEDKKAFNNSMSIGCYASKLTKQINGAGAIYIDIPVELQGSAPSSYCYSEYTNIFYYSYGSQIYQVDLNEPDIKFVRIGEWLKFYKYPFLIPTKYGVFIKGETYWYLYNEKTGSFKKLSIRSTGDNNYWDILPLSNGDILTVRHANYQTLSGDIYMFNIETKDFDTRFISTDISMADYEQFIIDSSIGIFILVGLYSETTNSTPRRALYKYNESTKTYDLVGKFPTTVTQYYGNELRRIFPLIGTIAVVMTEGSSGEMLYVLKNKEFIKVLSYSAYEDYHLQFQANNNIIQSSTNPNILFIGYTASYGKKVYKYNIDTEVLETLYSDSSYNNYSYVPPIIEYHNKILSIAGIYDCETDTLTTKSLNIASTDSFIINNDKLYRLGYYELTKYNESAEKFELVVKVSDSAYQPRYIIKDEHIYASSGDKGVFAINTLTDEVTNITTNKYGTGLKLDNKIYYTSENYNMLVINEDNTYNVLSDIAGYNSLHSWLFDVEINDLHSYYYGNGYVYKGLDFSSKIWYDSKNKKVTSINGTLIDLSESTKTYSLKYGATENKLITGELIIDSSYTELVIPFNEQPTSDMYTLTQTDITNVENMLGESLSDVDCTISERRINNKLNKLIGGNL